MSPTWPIHSQRIYSTFHLQSQENNDKYCLNLLLRESTSVCLGKVSWLRKHLRACVCQYPLIVRWASGTQGRWNEQLTNKLEHRNSDFSKWHLLVTLFIYALTNQNLTWYDYSLQKFNLTIWVVHREKNVPF